MKRVLFYIHNGWVFGKIHNELIKVLYPDLYCDILCWSQSYSHYDLQLLNEKYDLFVSTPGTCFFLHTQYGVPYEKMVGMVHQDWDIFDPLENKHMAREDFNRLAGYAVICPLLTNISLSYGISRLPDIVPVGIMCSHYERPISENVTRLGYFSAPVRKDRGDFDIKRGHLAGQVAERAGLELVSTSGVNFLATDKLYNHVDLTIFCSLIEGNPYVALESMAAGVPVLGTSVGLFPALASGGGGIVLPFDEQAFVEKAVYDIAELKMNYELYAQMSMAAKEKSKQVDWSVLRPTWLSFLQRCLPK